MFHFIKVFAGQKKKLQKAKKFFCNVNVGAGVNAEADAEMLILRFSNSRPLIVQKPWQGRFCFYSSLPEHSKKSRFTNRFRESLRKSYSK